MQALKRRVAVIEKKKKTTHTSKQTNKQKTMFLHLNSISGFFSSSFCFCRFLFSPIPPFSIFCINFLSLFVSLFLFIYLFIHSFIHPYIYLSIHFCKQYRKVLIFFLGFVVALKRAVFNGLWRAFYARSPRILLASWMSLGMMVTRLAWMAQRLVSSKRPTK